MAARRFPQPPHVHFTRAWVVLPFVRFLAQVGCPVERHLALHRISPRLLENGDNAVPLLPALRFLESAARVEGIDHVGLRAAQTTSIDELGGLRRLMTSSRNLRDYLHRASREFAGIDTNSRYEVAVEGGRVRFRHVTLDTEASLDSHLFALGATIATLRAVVGPSWCPDEVLLPCGEAAALGEISDAFQHARVRPESRGASFTFPVAFLGLEPPRPPVSDGDLTALDAGGFRRAVQQLVACLVLDGHADVGAAADAAGMSIRTLQRRLRESGIVFSRVALEARIELAERWLRDGDRPIADIASALGYTDHANFTRAFRRVNGVSPRCYRQALRGGQVRLVG